MQVENKTPLKKNIEDKVENNYGKIKTLFRAMWRIAP